MKCRNPLCNTELDADDRFCGTCGYPTAVAGQSKVNNGVLSVSSKTPSEAMAQEARTLVRQGRKIEAIKLVRGKVGCGLKEAKDFVESL